MNKNEYVRYAESRSSRSPIFKNCLCAFCVGGLICCIAQGLLDLYKLINIPEETSRLLVSMTLIVITAILTGFGIFDKLAKRAGAGTLVPITGFANAVVAPAIDTTDEGLVLGLGAKIFTIAGPVILYGTLASVIYGIIYYIVGLIF